MIDYNQVKTAYIEIKWDAPFSIYQIVSHLRDPFDITNQDLILEGLTEDEVYEFMESAHPISNYVVVDDLMDESMLLSDF